MTEKYDFLAQLSLFDALTEAELLALDAITEEYEFDEGAVIAYQRDVADSLYIVKSGRLYSQTVDERGIVRDTRQYLPGQWFGDSWLFVPGAHPATVKATSNGRFLLIRGSDFLQFLERYPDALEAMEPDLDVADGHVSGLSPEAWAEAQKSRLRAHRRSAAVSLLPEELVELYLRRSKWYLLLRLLPPAVGLLALPLWLFSLLNRLADESFWYGARLIVPLLFVLAFGLWLAFELLDWSNDYFVITNKHLIHREFSLRTFRTRVTKIPIDQIQSIAIVQPTFIANLFNYGTARVTTAAQKSAIYFDNIDDPRQVEEVLNRLRQRVQTLNAAQEQTMMRRSVEGYFQVPPGYEAVAEGEEAAGGGNTAVLPPSGMYGLWRRFVRRYQGRVEEGGVITYRKHFIVLFKVTLWPVLSLLAFFVINGILLAYSQFTPGDLLLIDVIIFLGLFAWLTWQVEDWRNDTFQLTDRYVIDIDRRPFGFGESRKQAELSNVQNINSDRPSFWATVFNFGNVIIDTAGAQADIVFETVANPNRVQSDIFKRRDQYRRLQAIKQGDQRRKEYAVLLDVYKQATEQNRIPRRTPTDDTWEE